MTSTAVFIRTMQEIARFAGKDDTRAYINGVFVENHDGFAIYVGTDGHRLCARRIEHEDIKPIGNFTIPHDVLQQWKFKPKDDDLRATLTQQPDGSCIISDGSAARMFKPVEGTYPEWRRVASVRASGEMGQYNWDYMIDFVKMGKALGLGHPRLMPNGIGPALVTFGKDEYAYGVLMPMRADDVATASPDWINTTTLKIAA